MLSSFVTLFDVRVVVSLLPFDFFGVKIKQAHKPLKYVSFVLSSLVFFVVVCVVVDWSAVVVVCVVVVCIVCTAVLCGAKI